MYNINFSICVINANIPAFVCQINYYFLHLFCFISLYAYLMWKGLCVVLYKCLLSTFMYPCFSGSLSQIFFYQMLDHSMSFTLTEVCSFLCSWGGGGVWLWSPPRRWVDPQAWRRDQKCAKNRWGWMDGRRPQWETRPFPGQLCKGNFKNV